MPRQPANLPASIHQRLLNLSQDRNDEFNQVLTLFAIERLLYRLAQSSHVGRFILKGALLFLVWDVPVHRPTRDIDLLGFGTNSAVALMQLFQELCRLPVVDDGLFFDPASIQVGEIRADEEYIGQRVELVARLGGRAFRCKLILVLVMPFYQPHKWQPTQRCLSFQRHIYGCTQRRQRLPKNCRRWLRSI